MEWSFGKVTVTFAHNTGVAVTRSFSNGVEFWQSDCHFSGVTVTFQV